MGVLKRFAKVRPERRWCFALEAGRLCRLSRRGRGHNAATQSSADENALPRSRANSRGLSMPRCTLAMHALARDDRNVCRCCRCARHERSMNSRRIGTPYATRIAAQRFSAGCWRKKSRWALRAGRSRAAIVPGWPCARGRSHDPRRSFDARAARIRNFSGRPDYLLRCCGIRCRARRPAGPR